jgi:hypothetical protein
MDLGFVGIQRLLLITVKKLTRATPLNLSPNAICWPDFCSKVERIGI